MAVRCAHRLRRPRSRAAHRARCSCRGLGRFGFDRVRKKFVDELQDARAAAARVDAPEGLVVDDAVAGEACEPFVVEHGAELADDVVGRSRERGLRAEADGVGRRHRHIAAVAIERKAVPLPRALIIDEQAGTLDDELHQARDPLLLVRVRVAIRHDKSAPGWRMREYTHFEN